MRPRPKKKTDAEIREKMKTIKTRNVERTATVKSGDWHDLSEQFESFARKHNVSWEDVRLIAGNSWSRSYLSVKTPETEAEKFRRLRFDADRSHRIAVYKWEQEKQLELNRKAEAARWAVLNGKSNDKCCPSNCCCRKS